MIQLTRKEADIIDYLRSHAGQLPYAVEIAQALGIPKVTVYRNLDSLEAKGVVEKIQKGRMKIYKLTDKWRRITEIIEAPSRALLEEQPSLIKMKEKLPLKPTQKIWIAIRTPFQVNFFYPLIKRLEKRFDFLITARNHDFISQMLDAKGLEYIPVGKHEGAELQGRLEAYAQNVRQLIPIIKNEKPDILITERWPEAVRVAYGFDIPAWTIYYDEREHHVNRMVFPLSAKVFAPTFYTPAEVRENGLDLEKIVWFRGFHTCYLKGVKFSQKNMFKERGIEPPIVLLRPAPEFATFFSGRQDLLEGVISSLADSRHLKDMSVVVLPRTKNQAESFSKYPVIVMNEAFPETPIAYADMIVGESENMLAEAFVLGKPAISAIYWKESKPVEELHKHIQHILNPRLVADKIVQFIDFHEQQRFQEKAQAVILKMENPIEIIENEINKLYTELSQVESIPKRSHLDIYMGILKAVALRPLTLTHIMQTVNISYSQTKKNLEQLKSQGLINEQKDIAGNKYYQTTNEGIQVLRAYSRLESYLR